MRNMVGRTLGLTPDNVDAANDLDNSQDWFTDGETRDQIDLAVQVMIDESGGGGQVRAIPAFLAGEKVGAQSYALFEIQDGDGDITLIDATILGNTIYTNTDVFDEDGNLRDDVEDRIHGDWRFDSFEDFQNDNALPDDAKIYVPERYMEFVARDANYGGSLLEDIDHDGRIYSEQVAGRITWGERAKFVGDIAIAGLSIAGAIAATPFTGGGSLLVGAAIVGGLGWGAYRTWDQWHSMSEHGQSMSWDNPNARGVYISGAGIALSTLALGGSGVLRVAAQGSRLATAASLSTRAFGTGAFAVGAYQTGTQGYALATHAGEMSTEQLGWEVLTFSTGLADMTAGHVSNRIVEANHTLKSEIATAVEMNNRGAAIPESLGRLEFSEDGVSFTSARDGRRVQIDDAQGMIRRPDYNAQMPDLWHDLEAQIPAGERTLNIGEDGEIRFTAEDGRSVSLRAGDGEEAPTVTRQAIEGIDADVRQSLGLDENASSASRFVVVDDPTFRTINAELNGTERATTSEEGAVYAKRTDGSDVIVVKEGALTDGGPLARSQVAHELIRSYMNPEFRRVAAGAEVPVLDQKSNMLLGAAEYLAWRETDYSGWRQGQPENERLYQDFAQEQVLADGGRNPARWAHSVEAMVAEQVFLSMGESAFRSAVFDGDPMQLARFRELSELHAAPTADRRGGAHETPRRADGCGKGRWSVRIHRRNGPPRLGCARSTWLPNGRTTSPKSLRLAGPLVDLIADIHAHSRPYTQESGDRPQDLINMVGPFSRILIGDIPQACGHAHYSNSNASDLHLDSHVLDLANTRQFTKLRDDYRRWMNAIDEVERSDPHLAREIETLIIGERRDADGNPAETSRALFEDKISGLGWRTKRRLRQAYDANPALAVRGDLSLTAFNPGDPGAVARLKERMLENPGMYSFLGEMTLEKEMVTALLRGDATMLQHPASKALLETLQDAGAATDLDATMLGRLDGALTDFTNSARSEQVKKPVNDLREALASGDTDRIATAARGLRTDIEAMHARQEQTFVNLQKVLEFANETGIGVLIHCDWGEAHAHAEDGRLEGTTDHDYEYFDQLVDLVSQYDNANIVLAHTGLGRYVRPGEGMVTLSDGTQVPAHIGRIFDAKERAPNVKFDISWNDVGEAFVMDDAMSDGLTAFARRYPDSIIFGSDTVKPDNAPQYRQASTTLMPFFEKLAVQDPAALRQILRDNYVSVLDHAEQRVVQWAERELGTTPEGRAKIATMQSDLAQLRRGRQIQNDLANARFDQVIADMGAMSGTARRLPPAEGLDLTHPAEHPPLSEMWDAARLGEAPPRDQTGRVAENDVTRFTSRGTPADEATQRAANWRLFGDFVRSGLLTAAGAAASQTPLVNLAAIMRQEFFHSRLAYKEFVRNSWEAIFERRNVTPENLSIFLDGVMTVGKASNVSEERLRNVADLTMQFQVDHAAIDRIPVEREGWTQERKDEATAALIGLYQVDVDRALGLQASSLDMFNPQLRPGRAVNDRIAETASFSLGASAANGHALAASGQGWQAALGGFASAADISALLTMTAKAYFENYGGRTGIPIMERPWAKYLNAASLGSLSVGGGARLAGDIAAIAANPVGGALFAVVDGTVAWLGAQSALHEYARVHGGAVDGVTAGKFERALRAVFRMPGTVKPGKIANINRGLLAAIAVANLGRAGAWMSDKLEDLRTDREVEVDTIPVPTTITPPLTQAPGAPPSLTAPAAPEGAITVPPPAGPADTPVDVMPRIGLNVRTGPSIDAPKLGAFAEGAPVLPTGREETDDDGRHWSEVIGMTPAGNIVEGWVADEYVRGKTEGLVEVVPSAGLNLRAGPSVGEARVGGFPDGTVLQPTGRDATDAHGNRWIEVTGPLPTGNVETGWVAGQYVRPVSGADVYDGHEAGFDLFDGQPIPATEFIRRYAY